MSPAPEIKVYADYSDSYEWPAEEVQELLDRAVADDRWATATAPNRHAILDELALEIELDEGERPRPSVAVMVNMTFDVMTIGVDE